MPRQPFWNSSSTLISALLPDINPSVNIIKWHQTLQTSCIQPYNDINLAHHNYQPVANTSTKIKRKKSKKTFEPLKTRKIRVYPSPMQKDALYKWFKASRDSWNASLFHIKKISKF